MAEQQALTVVEKLEAAPPGDWTHFLKAIDRHDIIDGLVQMIKRQPEGKQRSELLGKYFDGLVQHVREVTNLSIQDVTHSNISDYDTSKQVRGANTKDDAWPVVLLNHIEEMHDCTYETIKAALGFTFGIGTSESRSHLKKRASDIKDYLRPSVEAEVQHVAQSYILPIVQACVRAGLGSLPEELGIPKDTILVMKGIEGLMKPGNSSLDESEYERAKARGIMDWSIYLLVKGEEKRYITIGENKLSSKWSSSWLPTRLGGEFTNREAEWPLRQQANYCLNGNTSWSFLYTPRETVLCRFYVVPADNGKVNLSKIPWFGLQWKSIPIQPDIPRNPLGTVMGIWAWIVFAFVDKERGLKTRDKLCPLAEILPQFGLDPDALVLEKVQEGVSATVLGYADTFRSAAQTLDCTGKDPEVDEISEKAQKDIEKMREQIVRDKLKRKLRGDKELPPKKRVWEGRLRSNVGNAVVGIGLP